MGNDFQCVGEPLQVQLFAYICINEIVDLEEPRESIDVSEIMCKKSQDQYIIKFKHFDLSYHVAESFTLNDLIQVCDNLAGNYMFKVNNRNTGSRCEICSKSTIKTPERR